MWGESSSSVHDFLVANGVSDGDADNQIEGFCAERNAEIRKVGLKNTLIGVGIIGGTGILVYVTSRQGYFRSSARCAVVGVVGVCYGMWKLVNGIFALVRPQSEEKSITDLLE
jgi:hypothetical protein